MTKQKKKANKIAKVQAADAATQPVKEKKRVKFAEA
jgi:hypothetical protein